MNDFQFRDKQLTRQEIELLTGINLSESRFKQFFSEVVISELITNSIKLNRIERKPVEGILFCGKMISIGEVTNLKTQLNKFNLEFEISWDVLTPRYYDFKFPYYINKDNVIDMEKQYYKIYPLTNAPDFIDQIDFINEDKSAILQAYLQWQSLYDITKLWVDRTENLLLINVPISDDIVNHVFDDKRKIYWDFDRNIEMGWSTVESIKDDIKNRLPFIDLCFYNK